MIGGKFVSVFKRPAVSTIPGVRGSASGTLSSSTAITTPTNVAGDILVCFFAQASSIEDSANANGWSKAMSGGISGQYKFVCSFKTSAGGDTTTPIVSSVTGSYICLALRNLTAIDALPTSAIMDASNFGTAATASSISPTFGNELLLTGYCLNSAPKTITVPAGQTGIGAVDDGTYGVNVGYELLSVAGSTGTRSATLGANTAWRAGSVSFR